MTPTVAITVAKYAEKHGFIYRSVRYLALFGAIVATVACGITEPRLGPGCTFHNGAESFHDEVCPVPRYETSYTVLAFGSDLSLTLTVYRVEWDR